MNLQEDALHTIQRNQLIPAGSTVVVGVSGGPDSLALLHVLRSLSSRLDCRLHAATFDHLLRGESSAGDLRFVAQVGTEWGLPVSTGRADVRQMAEARGVSIEVAARQARYDFLAQVAREVGASRVAVAHHADDQAETVLMHIIRGAGIEGLGGMSLQAPMPYHPEVTLIRPFLKATRAQIEAYCREQGLTPREDVTNRDLSLLRNYLRWETLPYLEKLNPNIRRALTQLAEIARVEHDYMEQQIRQVITQYASVQSEQIVIARAAFRQLHPALQRRFVYWAARRLAPAGTDIGYVLILGAVEVGLSGQVGALALLSNGLQLRVDYDTLVVERMDVELKLPHIPLLKEGAEITVAIPGTTPLGTWQLYASTMAEDSIKARLAISEGDEVILRTRREGDRFAPPGMGGHTQKVSRWMINRKIPKSFRDRIPLLVVNGQIAAIIVGDNWAISPRFAADEKSPRVVYFIWVKHEH